MATALSGAVLVLAAGEFATTQSSVGVDVVPIMFIFYGFYDIGWTPLPFSHAAETMPYHMRLKGLSIMLSVQNIAQAFNQWVNPVALKNIKWHYYIFYTVLDVIYLLPVHFFFPEAQRLSVEEISVVYDTGRLGTRKAAADAFERTPANHTGGVVGEEDLDMDKKVAASDVESKDSAGV